MSPAAFPARCWRQSAANATGACPRGGRAAVAAAAAAGRARAAPPAGRPSPTGRGARALRARAAPAGAPELWIETTNQAVLTAAVESGHGTVLFGPHSDAELAERWQRLAFFTALRVGGDGGITDAAGNQA
ncbi:hypothetical protein Rsub_04017 [Raphidocelis subcapitata]|uniref:Uncharacterized protein n=1 Tax=Raphidocelis subcapitata TaxID=307507 RepID=A0A2V0P1K2_9CHLO|nr:hypothetical protein Rsub_04017 [Raphidocelis subcapitata]|eukprot:GBF91713.1 hypothetical protein Rsub_04017 [Raphidocelis subcapitata]